MDNEINDRSVNPLIRIADALEEILRLVKEDQEKMGVALARLAAVIARSINSSIGFIF